MRDSVCPRCGRIGKKRLYQTGNGYVQVRYDHWDDDAQTRCYIAKKDLITTER